jgi:hypothetical protein
MSKKLVKSLNEGLPVFYLEHLEQRLETDPLSIGALMDVDASNTEDGSDSFCWGYEFCNTKGNCEVTSCTWY